MPLRNTPPMCIPLADFFGPALDASTTWMCVARRGVILRINRSFRNALTAAGTTSNNLEMLFPCWAKHQGQSTSLSCPCPLLAARPGQQASYCQADPARSPVHIASHELTTEGLPHGLRLVVIEPRRGLRPAEPAQHVALALLRVRSAIDEVEHKLNRELHTGLALLRPPGLSPREWDVAQALASGKRAPGIASALGISVHTVRNHLKSVYRKLSVRTQAELRRRLQMPSST